jgi:hypothetical protein
MWFDDGSSKALNAFLKSGIVEALCSPGGGADNADSESVQSMGSGKGGALGATGGGGTSGAGGGNPYAAAGAAELYSIPRLQEEYFGRLNVLGWSIRLTKPKVLSYFARRGVRSAGYVDKEGNAALHLVASSGGSVEMVETILIDRTVLLEQLNREGLTAGMLAAKHKNFAVAKALFKTYRADCRRALDVSYAAWVLAFVRRREKLEMNLQTGRYGDDDVLYFNIAPDPFYVVWYSP